MTKTKRFAGLMAVATVAAFVVPASAAGSVLRGPDAYGVIRLGDHVQADLSGACASAKTRVVATFGGTKVAGPAVLGCRPAVAVPSAAELNRAGWPVGSPLTLHLVSGLHEVPLTPSRLEPDRAAVTAGAPTRVTPVDDPLGDGAALAMGTGDVVDLGRVALTGLQSVDVRNFSSTDGYWELREGSAMGTAIASGQLGSTGCLTCAGDNGWFHSIAEVQLRPGQAAISDTNTLGDLTPKASAPHLYLAMVFVAGQVPAVVNWVDLNGPGVGMPHAFTSERGFQTLFDGSSFDGWAHVGPGGFVLRDGAMRAEHQPQDRGWAWLWYTRAQYADFVLRLRFKVENYEDNGGVLLRHVDPMGDPNRSTNSGDEMQVQEGFENLTGGIAHAKDATRLSTGMVGQWNDVEIVAVGAVYVIRINGHEVQRYRSTKARRGFLSVENEQLAGTHGGHLWYDDIRIHPCSEADLLCH